MKQGLAIIGKCLGSRQTVTQDGIVKNEFGVGVVRPDGFGGTTQVEFIISVRKKDLFNNELVMKIKNLIGKQVIVGVYPSAWEFNGKTGISYVFNSESYIDEFKE